MLFAEHYSFNALQRYNKIVVINSPKNMFKNSAATHNNNVNYNKLFSGYIQFCIIYSCAQNIFELLMYKIILP